LRGNFFYADSFVFPHQFNYGVFSCGFIGAIIYEIRFGWLCKSGGKGGGFADEGNFS
jgi:hypothetical protein